MSTTGGNAGLWALSAVFAALLFRGSEAHAQGRSQRCIATGRYGNDAIAFSIASAGAERSDADLSLHLQVGGECIGNRRSLGEFSEALLGWLLDGRARVAFHGGAVAVYGWTPRDIDARVARDGRYFSALVGSSYLGIAHDRGSATLNLELGVAGDSVAPIPELQNAVHRLIGASEAQGWSTRQGLRAVFGVGLDRVWRWGAGDVAVFPFVRANLSTLRVDASAGAWATWQRGGDPMLAPLPLNALPIYRGRPVMGVHYGFMAGASVRGVAYDASISAAARAIAAEPVVGQVVLGAWVGCRWATLSGRWVWSTPTHRDQTAPMGLEPFLLHGFGVIDLAIRL